MESNINDVKIFPVRGPWNTKSGGYLDVIFSIPYNDLMKYFFQYNPKELRKTSQDIRGLRSYRVSNLKKDSVGANEWHKIRNEIIFTPKGSIQLNCCDTRGNTISIVIDSGKCAWIPPYTMHTYKTLEDHTEIIVIANTLFDPTDPSTHDTYSVNDFAVNPDDSTLI